MAISAGSQSHRVLFLPNTFAVIRRRHINTNFDCPKCGLLVRDFFTSRCWAKRSCLIQTYGDFVNVAKHICLTKKL